MKERDLATLTQEFKILKEKNRRLKQRVSLFVVSVVATFVLGDLDEDV